MSMYRMLHGTEQGNEVLPAGYHAASGYCPVCGSNNVETLDEGLDDDYYYYEMTCCNCGVDFTDWYRLEPVSTDWITAAEKRAQNAERQMHNPFVRAGYSAIPPEPIDPEQLSNAEQYRRLAENNAPTSDAQRVVAAPEAQIVFTPIDPSLFTIPDITQSELSQCEDDMRNRVDTMLRDAALGAFFREHNSDVIGSTPVETSATVGPVDGDNVAVSEAAEELYDTVTMGRVTQGGSDGRINWIGIANQLGDRE